MDVLETPEPAWRKSKGVAAGAPLSTVETAPLGQPLVSKLCYLGTRDRALGPQEHADVLKRELFCAVLDADDLGVATALRDLLVRHEIAADDEFLAGESQNTALHLAAESGHDKVVAVLIDAGANVDAQNYVGQTPAHVAAAHSQVECIRLLGAPQALADFNLADDNGRTPGDVALAHRHFSCASVIQQLTYDDVRTHMKRRFFEELQRQKNVLRKKEVLFGRSMMALEGAHEFEVPAQAHLDDRSCFEASARLRAFAVTPYFFTHGQQRASAHLHAAREGTPTAPTAAAAPAAPRTAQVREEEETKQPGGGDASSAPDAAAETQRPTREWVPGRIPSQRWMPAGYTEPEPTEFIPGCISAQRWVDLSQGRPPDLGYSACV